jgi:hypothetical protein
MPLGIEGLGGVFSLNVARIASDDPMGGMGQEKAQPGCRFSIKRRKN